MSIPWSKNKPVHVAAIQYSLILAVCGLLFLWFEDNYRIGKDNQMQRCLAGDHKWFLVHLKDRTPQKGQLMVYQAKGLEPIFDDGRKMVKYLAAVPGDTVKVAQDGVWINGHRFTRYGPTLALEMMQRPPEDFYGERILNENEYWMLGDAKASFDSRYFGAITREQIVARASIF